jgi:hypothetical protein
LCIKQLWREDSKDGLKTGRKGRREAILAAAAAAAAVEAAAW